MSLKPSQEDILNFKTYDLFLTGLPGGKRPLEDLGRIILKWILMKYI
jgi:hypothetical protein